MSGAANELREAAALMRERAEAAKSWEGAWQVHETKPGRVIEVKGDGWDDAIVASCVDYGGSENGTEAAAHIASWHPVVALAVADWLDSTADGLERRGVTARVRPDERAALAVARAYLGEEEA